MGKTARETFRVPADLASAADLAAIDPRARPIGPRDKSTAAQELAELGERLDTLQEAHYAEATAGGPRAVLLVLQGMDTSGKGGVIRSVGGLFNPQGLRIATFKKPTDEELRHHFLWRVRRHVPTPGHIGIFDRSHYEDVLIARVDSLVPEDVWRRRYTEIAQFEAELDAQGITILKCMLHISPKEQLERLLARLDDPAKRWKHNPADIDARRNWPAYQEAYAEALRRTDTDAAPWYVIPSDRKWYRNWAIAALLAETLAVVDPRFPKPTYDVDAERARLAAGPTH
ncbi:PPK2 family polyphosphate kinase [Pseudonocardia zijingensis]|uniref:Polyphosphate--nucleotide phosphotransferase n=1 Tax=Pseudonocardia zijingensis TaxID=153376 RepID=A0ABN1N6G9_9PSEU